MARCVDCAWFPWKPGTDLSNLVVTLPCYPGSPRRRWSNDGVVIDHSCSQFTPKTGVDPSPQVTQGALLQELEPKVENSIPVGPEPGAKPKAGTGESKLRSRRRE